MAKPPSAAKYFNKLAVRVAGHRFLPAWAVLRHRGRRSGTQYVTPVAVIATRTTFLIAMAWGPDSDWARNVRAAGGCTIRGKGADYDCTEPTLVGKDVAMAAARGLTRQVLRRVPFPHGFIQLTRSAG